MGSSCPGSELRAVRRMKEVQQHWELNLSNFMIQNLPGKMHSFTACREIFGSYGRRNFGTALKKDRHYIIRMHPEPSEYVPICSSLISVIFALILSCLLRFRIPRSLDLCSFLRKFLYVFPNTYYMPHPSHIPLFNHSTDIRYYEADCINYQNTVWH
jgi:hypothetical protein